MGVGGRVGLLASEQEGTAVVAPDRRQVGTRSGVGVGNHLSRRLPRHCGFNDAHCGFNNAQNHDISISGLIAQLGERQTEDLKVSSSILD